MGTGGHGLLTHSQDIISLRCAQGTAIEWGAGNEKLYNLLNSKNYGKKLFERRQESVITQAKNVGIVGKHAGSKPIKRLAQAIGRYSQYCANDTSRAAREVLPFDGGTGTIISGRRKKYQSACGNLRRCDENVILHERFGRACCEVRAAFGHFLFKCLNLVFGIFHD